MIKTRSGLIGLLGILTLTYTLAAMAWPNADVLLVVRSFQITSSGAVVWRYRPALVKIWREGFRGDDHDLLTFAIVLGYGALGLNAFWLWLWRGALETFWMVDAAVNGYCVLVSCWAAILYTASPGADQGVLTRESKKLVVIVFAATFVLSVVGITATPAFVAVEQFLKPYMAESPLKSGRRRGANEWRS
jgi:hypothetical protein